MFWLCLALILTAETAGLISLGYVAPDVLTLLLAPIVPFTLVLALVLRGKLDAASLQIRRLSPDVIARQEPRSPSEPSPRELSRSIIERALEMRRALRESPSEVRVEMCALGYRACANDMITLTHLINEELSSAGPFRRWRLRRYRTRATNALSAARDALPPGALRATRQEQQ